MILVHSNVRHSRHRSVPLGLVVAVAPVIYGCYAAYQVSQGVEYRYPYIADKIEGPRGVV